MLYFLHHMYMFRGGLLSALSSSTSGVFSGSSRWCFSLGRIGPRGPCQSTGAKGRYQTCCILLCSLHLRQIQLWLTGRALSLIHLALASLPSVFMALCLTLSSPWHRTLTSFTQCSVAEEEKMCDREMCSISFSQYHTSKSAIVKYQHVSDLTVDQPHDCECNFAIIVQ